MSDKQTGESFLPDYLLEFISYSGCPCSFVCLRDGQKTRPCAVKSTGFFYALGFDGMSSDDLKIK